MYCADMASSLFGSLHVLRWHGTELIWEPSCVALGTELIWEPSCVALAWHRLGIFI